MSKQSSFVDTKCDQDQQKTLKLHQTYYSNFRSKDRMTLKPLNNGMNSSLYNSNPIEYGSVKQFKPEEPTLTKMKDTFRRKFREIQNIDDDMNRDIVQNEKEQ